MRNVTLAFLLLLLGGCGGLEDYQETDVAPVQDIKIEYRLVFILDMGDPAFRERILKQTGAYRFFVDSAANFFRERIGNEDEIMLSQFSADDNYVLWQGRPRDFKRRFGNDPTDLTSMLAVRSRAQQCPQTYSALAETLEYILQLKGVRERETYVAIIVLSPMANESGDRTKLISVLREYAQVRSIIRFNWVDWRRIRAVQQLYQDAGLPVPSYVPIHDDRFPALTFDQ